MKPCIIFLGAPGSGKGSQTEKLKDLLGYETVSTGDLVRQQIQNKTQVGLQIEPFLKDGKLVPDELIVELFKGWIKDNQAAKGLILDGFPRTIEQANVFNQEIVEKFNLSVIVIYLNVSLDIITSRILSRIICTQCNAVYNRDSKPPKVVNICDQCGAPLNRRHDDNLETIIIRNQEYLKLTSPLIKVFANQLVSVNGNQNPEKVFADIIAGIKHVSNH